MTGEGVGSGGEGRGVSPQAIITFIAVNCRGVKNRTPMMDFRPSNRVYQTPVLGGGCLSESKNQTPESALSSTPMLLDLLPPTGIPA